jgi:hypothetical protein
VALHSPLLGNIGLLIAIFSQHADREYGGDGAKDAEKEVHHSQTVEDEITEELSRLRDPKTTLFRSVKIDEGCRTSQPNRGQMDQPS